jgi:hypothetical protein
VLPRLLVNTLPVNHRLSHAHLTRPPAVDFAAHLLPLISSPPPILLSTLLHLGHLPDLPQKVGENVLGSRADVDGGISEELEQPIEEIGEEADEL